MIGKFVILAEMSPKKLGAYSTFSLGIKYTQVLLKQHFLELSPPVTAKGMFDFLTCP